jgi:hypothetical protein
MTRSVTEAFLLTFFSDSAGSMPAISMALLFSVLTSDVRWVL